MAESSLITEEIKKAFGGNERLHLILPETGTTVYIEYSERIEYIVKPLFIKIFGMNFVSAPKEKFGKLLKRSFDAEPKDIEICKQLLAKVTNHSVIKSVPKQNN